MSVRTEDPQAPVVPMPASGAALHPPAATGATKKVHIETWGCQMNAADSERMLALLQAQSYELTATVEDADLVLLNTCHIREKAKHKVLSRLGVLKDLKAGKPGMTIAVSGCVAQAEGRRLLKAAPQIDVLLGPGKIDMLPSLLTEHARSGKSAMAIGFAKHAKTADPGAADGTAAGGGTGAIAADQHDADSAADDGDFDAHGINMAAEADAVANSSDDLAALAADLPPAAHAATAGLTQWPVSAPQPAPPSLSGKLEVSRYVNIQQGCNNYCTFCVVPFTRGRELSRTPAEIIAESRALIAAGAREITLLGQNVNSYGSDFGTTRQPSGVHFAALLRQVAALPGLARLRFTTSNPHDFTPELAQLFAEEPKLGRYLHLPVQSGNDRILSRMQRKVTVAEYLERIAWLKSSVPDLVLSTDLIVGFPGETEAEFADTLALVERVGFSFAFTFKYSPRKNTPAARYQDQVPEPVKEERLARLLALQDRLSVSQNQAEVGHTRPVLFHYQSRKLPGHYYGRTEHFRLVRVQHDSDLVGQVLPVRLTQANKLGLLGELN